MDYNKETLKFFKLGICTVTAQNTWPFLKQSFLLTPTNDKSRIQGLNAYFPGYE
jgi:hypothetical protein